MDTDTMTTMEHTDTMIPATGDLPPLARTLAAMQTAEAVERGAPPTPTPRATTARQAPPDIAHHAGRLREAGLLRRLWVRAGAVPLCPGAPRHRPSGCGASETHRHEGLR
jgi:hypothetical protein